MLNRLGNLSIIGKLLGLSPFRTMDPLCNFREPNLHLGWISAGYVGFRLHQWPQDAQTWRFQGPADIQIYDDFQRFSVLTRVYHLTLQVQQVCSMSPSAPGTNVQGRQGFRQALEMRRGRDQKRTSSCDSKASLCGSSLNILAVLRQRQAQSGRGYGRSDVIGSLSGIVGTLTILFIVKLWAACPSVDTATWCCISAAQDSASFSSSVITMT